MPMLFLYLYILIIMFIGFSVLNQSGSKACPNICDLILSVNDNKNHYSSLT